MTYFTMANTYVKLSCGDIEINDIGEMIEDLKDTKFKFSKWFARSALIDKKIWHYTFSSRDKSLMAIALTSTMKAGRMTTV